MICGTQHALHQKLLVRVFVPLLLHSLLLHLLFLLFLFFTHSFRITFRYGPILCSMLFLRRLDLNEPIQVADLALQITSILLLARGSSSGVGSRSREEELRVRQRSRRGCEEASSLSSACLSFSSRVGVCGRCLRGVVVHRPTRERDGGTTVARARGGLRARRLELR